MLARAGGPLVDDRLAHDLEERPEGIDDVFLAADHDRQPRFAGADVAAGDGRVDGVDSFGLGGLGDLDGQRRLAGRHVDEHGPGLAPASVPSGPSVTSRTSCGIADDREDHVRRRGDRSGRIGELGPLFDQRLGLFGRPVEDRRLIPGRDQVPAHRSSPSLPCRSSRSASFPV